jgi:hypothetical protein
MKRGSPKAIRQHTELSLMLSILGDTAAPKDLQTQWQMAAALGDKSAQHSLPLFEIFSP